MSSMPSAQADTPTDVVAGVDTYGPLGIGADSVRSSGVAVKCPPSILQRP